MMEHLSAVALARMALTPETAEARKHVEVCPQCAREVESARRAAGTSHGRPLPERVRAAVERRAAEEKALAGLDLANRDRKSILAEPAFRTGAGVRRLVEAGMNLHDSDANAALELENAALEIAESLAAAEAAPEHRRLVVAALLAMGNAYRFIGRFADAHAILARAEAVAASLSVSAMEEGRIETTRAAVLLREYRLDEASSAKERARDRFAELGEAGRLIDVLGQEMAIAFLRRDFALARDKAEQALAAATASGDSLRSAHAENNLAITLQELGDLHGAATHFVQAIAHFDLLGSPVEKARAEWSLGLLSLRLDREVDGLARLERAVAAFRTAGNVVDAALILIDIVEYHLQSRRSDLARAALSRIEADTLPAYASAAMGVLRKQIERGDTPGFEDARRQLRLEL